MTTDEIRIQIRLIFAHVQPVVYPYLVDGRKPPDEFFVDKPSPPFQVWEGVRPKLQIEAVQMLRSLYTRCLDSSQRKAFAKELLSPFTLSLKVQDLRCSQAMAHA